MKLSTATFLACFISPALAFFSTSFGKTHTINAPATTTSLNLFGKKEGGENKGPGMMDQLAMLKKAQEVASKKQALDKELALLEHVGSSADGKVTVTVKYVPPPPMQQPGYEPAGCNIDEEYLSTVTSTDLSQAVADAMKDGYKKATEATQAKMQELTAELGKIMGDMQQPPTAS